METTIKVTKVTRDGLKSVTVDGEVSLSPFDIMYGDRSKEELERGVQPRFNIREENGEIVYDYDFIGNEVNHKTNLTTMYEVANERVYCGVPIKTLSKMSRAYFATPAVAFYAFNHPFGYVVKPITETGQNIALLAALKANLDELPQTDVRVAFTSFPKGEQWPTKGNYCFRYAWGSPAPTGIATEMTIQVHVNNVNVGEFGYDKTIQLPEGCTLKEWKKHLVYNGPNHYAVDPNVQVIEGNKIRITMERAHHYTELEWAKFAPLYLTFLWDINVGTIENGWGQDYGFIRRYIPEIWGAYWRQKVDPAKVPTFVQNYTENAKHPDSYK